jgi:dihydroxy-acid dehydratase
MITNHYSSKITKDFPAAQAMLYSTGIEEKDFQKAQVGIVSNWYEGNPCNMHLNKLGKKVKISIEKQSMIGFQFTTIGVSDGISMGTSGMRYSLPSRELIADSIETVVYAHHYDGLVAIPGCDKNMPGVLMALLRLNRPAILLYGGSSSSGYYKGKKLNIVSAFEALGEKKENNISEKEYRNIIKNSCTGAGSCGGMYTANTMALALEAMGMTLPGSSSFTATSYEKYKECHKIGPAIRRLLEENIKPKDIVTKKSLENAITMTIALGGSTNLVLHLLAIARTAEIDISLKDFQEKNKQVPLIGNLKPSGAYLMEDLSTFGGTPVIMKYLFQLGFLHGDCLTVTGRTLEENIQGFPEMDLTQTVVYPLNSPIKKNGHIVILYGNLAPEGAVAKITGKEGFIFSGFSRTFNSEEEANRAILNRDIHVGDVVVIRYVGPKGGPGMPEMLKPTSCIVGVGLGKDVALITDGRFSGGSHGFVVGHISPESQIGGPISLVEDGDFIIIDAKRITLKVGKEVIQRRRSKWAPPSLKKNRGYLYKYAKLVSSASEGCITDK